ncbi:MAG: lipase family protein [Kiloniellales bacterium]|nr:lipase family protein [Kiloniellales bacterium]
MTREEATGIPYDTSFRAVREPHAVDNFFMLHRPRSEAAWCAEFSRLAYCDYGTVLEGALARVGFSPLVTFESSGTEAFLAEGPAFAVLAFRGSDDLDAWIFNLNARPAPWRGAGEVHRGFAAALDFVWAEVEGQLAKLRAPLFITGHSQGAALATLAASLLPEARLITFGSPRVGTEAFKEAFQARTGAAQRYANNRDVVCHVPLYELGFRHVGEPYLIDPDGRVSAEEKDDGGFVALISRSLRGGPGGGPFKEARNGTLPREASDHAPINYVSALR